MPGSGVHRGTDKANRHPTTRRVQGRLYSKEHREKFRTDHSTATVERNPQEKGKFRLCIDGIPILEWFKMKFQELKEKLGVSHTQKEEDTPKRGFRL